MADMKCYIPAVSLKRIKVSTTPLALCAGHQGVAKNPIP